MAITQNLNVNPYYDDFDETKGYSRILFRPGYAVQARELTQLQTILQKQIERFGQHIFKEGSMVLGGQTLYENENVFYVKLQDTDTSGNSVDATKFIGKFIKKVGSTSVRAYVITATNVENSDPKTLIVKYFSAERFTNSDNIEDELSDYFATAASSSATGPSSILSVDDGVFFIDGFFAKVNKQTIPLDKYGISPTYRVGLEVSDTIADENSDTSLLDPALDASNYQAPGATRLKITLTLSKRSLTSVDDTKFIDLTKIENGVIKQRTIYPQYSVLEDTLARRTFDESGDYTVRPFTVDFRDDTLANNGNGFANAYNIIISPGKAYVKGYEFETISPTVIRSERARDFLTFNDYNLTMNYQNYVDVNNLNGFIDVKEHTLLNVHCVPAQSINAQTAVTATSTRIGTLRVRALDYQYGANTTHTDGAVYRAYVFDPNIVSLTGTAQGGNTNTLTLSGTASSFNGAYTGVLLTITSFSGNTSQTQSKVIQSYNGLTKNASIDGTWNYGSPNTSTTYSLDFKFADAESFERANTLTKMNISSDSKYSILTDEYQGAFISEKNYESLIFSFPNFAIKESSFTNTTYEGRKVYTGTFDAAGILGGAGGFSTGTGVVSAVTGTVSGSDAIDNFYVVLTSAGTLLPNNHVVNFLSTSNTVTVTAGANTSTVEIKVNGANNATATVYMKVELPYPESVGSIRKTKTLKVANTQIVTTTGPDVISSNVTLFNDETNQPGLQLNILSANTANLRDPATTQSLYIADVTNLRGVLDFGTYAPTTANLQYAVDYSESYTLETNQTDGAYDHSRIRLRKGRDFPKGNVVIYADYFSHAGSGYCTVDSYIAGGTAYKDIPTYTSQNTGKIYYLRDVVDFRPRRKDGSSGVNGQFEETIIGQSGRNFETGFSYYLPRIDKLVVTKNRKFELVQGVPSLTPKPPPDKQDGMTIYTLILPAYVSKVESITARYVDNRRYTMRDIGEIEQRVQNLEYFSTLNFLEKDALDETFIDDSTGLSRVKTGVVVDPFNNYKIADVTNEDYEAAVDLEKGEIRPSFVTEPYAFEIGSGSNYTANSTFVTPTYTVESFIRQPAVSSVISINPLNTPPSLNGGVITTPVVDMPDVDQPPEVIENPEGVNDLWAACLELYLTRRDAKKLRELRKELKGLVKSSEIATGISERKWRKGFRCYRGEWRWWEKRRNRKGKLKGTVTEQQFVDRLNLESESKISVSPTVARTKTYDKDNLNSDNSN